MSQAQVDSDINAMITNIQNQLTNSQSDANRATLNTLLAQLTAARATEMSAPAQRRSAEQAYYTYIYGDNYLPQLQQWYQTDLTPIVSNVVAQKVALLTQINEGINYLTTQLTYLDRLRADTGAPVGNHTTPVVHDTATDFRRAVQYQSSSKTINVWTNIINCIIVAYGCILIYVFRTRLTEPLILGTIIITFLSAIALDFILKFVYFIPGLFVKYVGWGYSPLNFSPWWYLMIPASLVLLYIIISTVL